MRRSSATSTSPSAPGAGEFTAEDEELAIALAAAAGAAIANARRFAESEQRRRWLDASGELVPLLLSGEAGQPHALIAQHAAAAAAADFSALAVPLGADQVDRDRRKRRARRGHDEPDAPLADSLAGQAILHRQAQPGHRRAAVKRPPPSWAPISAR